METSTLAQMAYRAFGNWSEWKTPQGKRMPDWEELPVSIKNAWTSAAESVAVLVRKEVLSNQASPRGIQ
jgi:hypothetical protein